MVKHICLQAPTKKKSGIFLISCFSNIQIYKEHESLIKPEILFAMPSAHKINSYHFAYRVHIDNLPFYETLSDVEMEFKVTKILWYLKISCKRNKEKH